MSGSIQPDQLVAAVLSDEVYHSEQTLSGGVTVPVIIDPPAGWELIPSISPAYDPKTGYYGEAWGKTTSTPGVYSEIMIVNRGTTFSQPGSDAFLSNPLTYPDTINTLHDAWPLGNSIDPTGDLWQTVGADAAIVASLFTTTVGSIFTDDTAPAIVGSANAFYATVRQAVSALNPLNANVPIIETGQSLGGALADAVVATQLVMSSAGPVSAYTFNALPYSYGFTSLTSAQRATANAAVTNYYVGNEVFTQETPADWWVFSSPIGGTAQISGNGTVAGRVILPDLAINGPSVLDPITVHNPDAAVAALFESLYQNAPAATVAAAVTLLSNEYSSTQTRPSTIQTILNLAAAWPGSTGVAPTTDNQQETTVPNLDESVTIEYAGSGTANSAAELVTIPLHGSGNIGSISVSSITPSQTSGAVSATETDVYDTSGNLIAIDQTTAFKDGSYTVNALNLTTRNVQETYSVAPDGTRDEQVFDSAGDLRTDISVSPTSVLTVKQDQGDPTLIADSTIDIGAGVVTALVEDSDQSVLAELNFGASATSDGTYVGLVVSPDGSADIVDGAGEDGTSGQLVDFGTAGLADDTLDITQGLSGTIDVTLDIEPGADTNIKSDQNLTGVALEFDFSGQSGTLKLDSPGSFTGTIFNFEPGNTIDLSGIVANGATLGKSNVLTVKESGSGSFTLQLDPIQNFTGINFDPVSDGQGGTDLILTKSLFGVGYNTSTNKNYLESIDPLTGKATLVNSFTFDTGYWTADTFTASQTDAFAVSSSGLLYDFNLATGAVTTKPSDNGLDVLRDNGATLLGIGYNSSTRKNYLESINSLTGKATLVASFTFNTGNWSVDTFAASKTDAFAVSSSGLLYDFNLASGAVTTLQSDSGLDALTYNGTTLVGIGFNTSNNKNYLETINPLTGKATLLASFTFNTGYWSVDTFAASQTDAFAVSSSGLLYDFNLATGSVTTTSSDSNLVSLASSPSGTSAPCFHAGTHIATPHGDILVEQLAEGCLVYTRDGVPAAIKWLGHRHIDCRRHPKPQDVWPVRISADAFDPGTPRRDLFLSPEHAVFVDDVLIPIKYLINGATIAQEPRDEVTYWHVELERHDVILAEGLPCESWLDTGSRAMFENASVTELYPSFARDAANAWAHDACAPLVESGALLEEVRTRLKALAGIDTNQPAEARQAGALRGFLDEASCEMVRGWAWQPDYPDTPAQLEILVNGEIVARCVANNELRPDVREAGFGDGRSGFRLRLSPPLSPFGRHVIQARRASDQAELGHSGRVIEAASRLDEPALTGFAAALQATVVTADEAERAALLRFMQCQTDRLLTVHARSLAGQGSGPEERPLALFIDQTAPAPDCDSASQAALDHMRALRELGYRVAFIANDADIDGGARAVLEEAGILCCGPPALASVEEALRRLGPDLALVYLHRVEAASLYGPLVRHHCPRAMLVYGVADLHFVRVVRQAALARASGSLHVGLLAESRHLRERELRAALMADRVITHSPAEAAILRADAPQAKVHVVPWSFPARPRAASFKDRRGIAFIGGYRHAPNLDAARWLVDEIMPLVWRQAPEIDCLLVGSHMPAELRAINRPGIVPVGYTPDLGAIFDRVRLTVAPLRYGAGIKGKVLQSLAAGLPCVCTSVAAEGLPSALQGCIGDSAAALAALIVRLHGDEGHNANTAAAGLRAIREEFSTDRVDRLMAAAIGHRAVPGRGMRGAGYDVSAA